MFLQKTYSVRSDDLDARLRETRFAFLLEHSLDRAVYFARALAEAGRADEARALAATPLDGPEPSPNLQAYALALIDLHDAKLDRGLSRLLETKEIGLFDIVSLAAALGRMDTVSSKVTLPLLALEDPRFKSLLLNAGTAAVALCMRAPRELAVKCLNRAAALGVEPRLQWGSGGEELFRGAERFAVGDMKGAVAVWRPLVAGPNWDIVRVLPTDAFERAGEADLAGRLDARKMSFRNIAGISEAAPREARRALSRGDKPRAKELAQKVVEDWEVADTNVPAVAEMHALLKAIDR